MTDVDVGSGALLGRLSVLAEISQAALGAPDLVVNPKKLLFLPSASPLKLRKRV
jgi:hypothetical protein